MRAFEEIYPWALISKVGRAKSYIAKSSNAARVQLKHWISSSPKKPSRTPDVLLRVNQMTLTKIIIIGKAKIDIRCFILIAKIVGGGTDLTH